MVASLKFFDLRFPQPSLHLWVWGQDTFPGLLFISGHAHPLQHRHRQASARGKIFEERLRNAEVASRMKHDLGRKLKVQDRRVGPADGHHFFRRIRSQISPGQFSLGRQFARQISGFVQQAARKLQPGRIVNQHTRVDCDSR